MTHLAVLRAYAGRPPVGVTLFVEGEEESGSPTLTALLHEHHEALAWDVIVIADSANPAVDVPGLTTSLRGLVDVIVEVAMLERQAHSGVFGGPVGDALTALCHTLAGCTTSTATSPSRPGQRHTDAPDPDEATFRADAGLLPGVELIGIGSDRRTLLAQARRRGAGHRRPPHRQGRERPPAARPRRRQHAPRPGRRRREGPAGAGRAPGGARPVGRAGPRHPGPRRRRAHLPRHQRRGLRRRPARVRAGVRHGVVEAGIGGSIPFIAESPARSRAPRCW